MNDLGPARGYNILVIDDEEPILQAVKVIFEKHGHQVVTMTDGQSALKSLNIGNFDFIYLDINMPGWNGYQILERIRSLTSSPKIIFLTGNDTADSRLRFYLELADGTVNGIVIKPFTIKELVDSLKIG